MRVRKSVARPCSPTKREVEERKAARLPYRPWCEHCAHEEGISSPHTHQMYGEKLGITISKDCGF